MRTHSRRRRYDIGKLTTPTPVEVTIVGYGHLPLVNGTNGEFSPSPWGVVRVRSRRHRQVQNKCKVGVVMAWDPVGRQRDLDPIFYRPMKSTNREQAADHGSCSMEGQIYGSPTHWSVEGYKSKSWVFPVSRNDTDPYILRYHPYDC